MSLYNYFQPSATQLPTAQDAGISESYTAGANDAVERQLSEDKQRGKKRKRYTVFSDEQRAEIGKYAAENGNKAALEKFRRDIPDLGESTIRLFKKKYYFILKEQKRSGVAAPLVKAIPSMKRGRPLTIGALDGVVQSYIRALREAGTPINASIVIAAANGIVCSKDCSLLAENGGHIDLGAGWAKSLLTRMGYVKRKCTTSCAGKKLTPEEFEERKISFLSQISGLVAVHSIPADLIINSDQTGINLVPAGHWTLEQRGAQRVEICGVGDKRQITATFAATMSGLFLPMQLLYSGKTNRCHPKYTFPPSFDVYHTPNHWSNTETCLRFVSNIIVPYVIEKRKQLKLGDSHPALLIFDAFSGQCGEPISDALEENKILVVKVPGKCTDKLQPLDLSVNKPAKDFLRGKFGTWYATLVQKELDAGKGPSEIKVDMSMAVIKEVSATWLTGLYDHLCSSQDIIKNGFRKAGITDAIQSFPVPAPDQVHPCEDDMFADLDD